MEAASGTWQTELSLLVRHSSEPLILTGVCSHRPSLRRLSVPGKWSLMDAGRIGEAARRELGIEVTVLDCLRWKDDGSAGVRQAVYALENHDPSWQPPAGWRWSGREVVGDLQLDAAGGREVVDAYLREMETSAVPERRPPWARPGWFAEASSWLLEQLGSLGYSPAGPVEQVKSWGLSCILRSRTNSGDFYFKEVCESPLFANEPALTQALAQLVPDHIPRPVAVDAHRRWTVLEDFGQEFLLGCPDMGVWEKALSTLARIQMATVPHTDRFLSLGCADRRLEQMPGQIDALVADPEATAGLEGHEVERLRALAPRLKEMCAQLASFGVPQTLVHGDANAGNVAIGGAQPVFFDWTDGCVSHPFFDLNFLPYRADAPADIMSGRDHLHRVYLSMWTDYEPMDRIRKAWALAQVLGRVFHAVSYQYLLPGLAEPWRLWRVPGLLRQVLTSAEESGLV